jgi:hypothetical protein
MKGIDKEFDFGVLFHSHYSLSYRKEQYAKYNSRYNARLYSVVKGFSFPRLIEARDYNDDHFMYADGFVVGNQR